MTTCFERLTFATSTFTTFGLGSCVLQNTFSDKKEDIPQIQSKKAFNHATKRFREDKMEMNGALRKKKVNFHGVSE